MMFPTFFHVIQQGKNAHMYVCAYVCVCMGEEQGKCKQLVILSKGYSGILCTILEISL